MAVDPTIRDAYRRALDRAGEPVTFVRVIGDPPNVTDVRATVTARVWYYGPQPDVMAIKPEGGITQGNRKIIVLNDDLLGAGFPVPLQKNDKAIVEGEALNITRVDPNTRELAGAIEAMAEGV